MSNPPHKDGLDEALVQSQTLALQLAATSGALSALAKTIEMWNTAHCADCFSLWLETFQHKLAKGKIVLFYLPEDDES